MPKILSIFTFLIFLLTFSLARAEVTICTEIDSVPFTITMPGKYCLKQNLVNTTDPAPSFLAGAIEIESHNVTVDLNGFSLTNDLAGPANRMNGIVAFHTQNVTVRNGHVEGFSTAVLLGGLFAERSTVENIRANNSNYRGMFVVGKDSIIRNNHVTNAGPGDMDSASTGITLVFGENSVVEGNVVSWISETASASGIAVGYGASVSVRDNSVFGIRDATQKNGIAVVSITRAEISRNRLLNTSPGDDGIADLGFSSQIGCFGNAISGFAPATSGCDVSVGDTVY
ncbi:MAG: right-handed parallel beta-helix repeat-containing protein [Pseudomonadota bacterium]